MTDQGRTAIEALPPDIEGPVRDALHQELESRTHAVDFEAEAELSMPATLLVGDRPDLFQEVDRLRAEGELRLAVIPPLVAMAVLLTVEESTVWLAAIPGLFLLFIQGIRRDFESRKTIADAMSTGKVASSSIARFSEWVGQIPNEAPLVRERLSKPS